MSAPLWTAGRWCHDEPQSYPAAIGSLTRPDPLPIDLALVHLRLRQPLDHHASAASFSKLVTSSPAWQPQRRKRRRHDDIALPSIASLLRLVLAHGLLYDIALAIRPRRRDRLKRQEAQHRLEVTNRWPLCLSSYPSFTLAASYQNQPLNSHSSIFPPSARAWDNRLDSSRLVTCSQRRAICSWERKPVSRQSATWFMTSGGGRHRSPVALRVTRRKGSRRRTAVWTRCSSSALRRETATIQGCSISPGRGP